MIGARSSPSTLVQHLTGRSVLIVGDVMLDHFVIGRVERISPEAPVPVVRFEHEEFRLGGAANVAHNVAALGGRVELVGLVGGDPEAARLRRDLETRSIGCAGLVVSPDRCTTRKLRVVTTRNQQVARIDYENDSEIGGEIEGSVVARVDELSAKADAILVSDYLKGVVSRQVAAAAIRAGRDRGIPVLIDPKVPHVDYYAGATLITRGEHGMWLHTPDGDTALDAEAREVADVTGAGDTVIGTIALGLAAGGSLQEAARLANRAAGIVVGKFGPATVTVEELR